MIEIDRATAKFDDFPKWEGKGLPLRENCDLANPRQLFLWMFTAMPGVKGAPLLTGVDLWELQSFRMWQLGAGIVAEPVLKYRPPSSVLNAWTAQGTWVGMDEPDPPRKSLSEVVDEMPQAHRMALGKVMLDKMGLGEAKHPGIAAPAGHLRLDEIARRLKVAPGDLVAAFADLGIDVTPESYVEREHADRLLVHMGLT